TGSIQMWQSSTDNFTTWGNIASLSPTLGFNNLATTTSFRAMVQNGVCSTVASSSFTVTINGISIGGNAVGPTSSQCLGSNSGTVSIVGYVGNVLGWELSTDNFTSSSPLASTSSFVNFSNLTSNTSYRARIQNGVCASTTSSIVTVTVGGVSVGGSISGPASSLCTGSTGTLTLTGYTGNILGWQSSLDNFTSIVSISTTSSTLPFINLTTSTSFRALVQNGACASSTSAAFTVTINGLSIGGSVAGPTTPVCSNSNLGTLSLSGFVGNVLAWQSSTDNFATFSAIATTNSFLGFNNLITTTSFRAVVQNGGCNSVTSAAFTISVSGISLGGSVDGPTTPLCSGANSGTISVSGYVGSILNWESSTDNFSTITNIASTASSISFLNLTTTTSYRAVVQNGPCTSTTSSIFTITIGGISVGGTTDGPTTWQCTGSNAGTITLSGFSGNVVFWESSTDNFVTTNTISSTSNTLAFTNLATSTSFRAIVQNGSCSTASSTSFIVSVSGLSIGGSVSGPTAAQCAGSNLFNVSLSGFNGSIVGWESSIDNFTNISPISSSLSIISLSNL
ncbi:MAG: hypothetical protein K2Q22_02395, partial [Cytophagales bacterium]|nr:hypothetical protein [Cytophagales bacterium]